MPSENVSSGLGSPSTATAKVPASQSSVSVSSESSVSPGTRFPNSSSGAHSPPNMRAVSACPTTLLRSTSRSAMPVTAYSQPFPRTFHEWQPELNSVAASQGL